MGIISSLSTEKLHPTTTKMKLIFILWAACLVVHVKGDLGVRKIVLKNGGGYFDSCGATRAGLFLYNKVGVKVLFAKHQSGFSSGDTITWDRDCRDTNDDECFLFNDEELRNRFDDTFTVQIKTVAGQYFCPREATIELDDGSKYITKFANAENGWYSQSTNNINHRVLLQWTPSLHIPQITCPNNFEDACPVNDMFAYAARVQERRACVFTCPHVTTVNRTLDSYDGKGYHCVNANHDKLQFEWCCKTKRTSEIPYCPDIVEGNGDVEPPPSDNDGNDYTDGLDEFDDNLTENRYNHNGFENRNNLHQTSHHRDCPTHGCPKENIKYYWHGQGQTPCTLNEQCQKIGLDGKGLNCLNGHHLPNHLELCCSSSANGFQNCNHNKRWQRFLF